MNAGPISVAVVGADASGRGFGARAHAAAVLAVPGLELRAVCTSRAETASAAAARWGVERWYADYERLMDDRDVDIVTVAVPVRHHLKIAAAALEAGKSVYCEWPLCLTARDARRLTHLARGRDVITAAGLQGRFGPAVRYARSLLDAGAIGQPLSFLATQILDRFDVSSDRHWLAREDEGSGALHVAAGHVTDVAEFLLGQVEAVAGTRATLRPSDVYSDTGGPLHWTASDTVTYAAKTARGCVGNVYVTYLGARSEGFTLRIFGDDGQLTLRAPGYVSFTRSTVEISRDGDAHPQRLRIPREFVPSFKLPADSPATNVAIALAELAGCTRAGERFRPDFEDASHIHEVLEDVGRGRLHRVGCRPHPRGHRRRPAGR
jgi:predicted dehydrogenase